MHFPKRWEEFRAVWLQILSTVSQSAAVPHLSHRFWGVMIVPPRSWWFCSLLPNMNRGPMEHFSLLISGPYTVPKTTIWIMLLNMESSWFCSLTGVRRPILVLQLSHTSSVILDKWLKLLVPQSSFFVALTYPWDPLTPFSQLSGISSEF